MENKTALLLRQLPAVHDCLAHLAASDAVSDLPLGRLKYCVRLYLDSTRRRILAGKKLDEDALGRNRFLEELICYVPPIINLALPG